MKRVMFLMVILVAALSLSSCQKGWLEEAIEGEAPRARGQSSAGNSREQGGSSVNSLKQNSYITKNGAHDTLKKLWPANTTVNNRSLAQLAAKLSTHYEIDWGTAAQSSELVLDGLKSSALPNHEIGLIFVVDLLDSMSYDYENERAPVFNDLWHQFSYGWDNFHESVKLKSISSTQHSQPDTTGLSSVLSEWVDDAYMMLGLDWNLYKDSKDLIDLMESVDVLEAEDWVIIMTFDLLAYLEGEAVLFNDLWENVLSYNWTQTAYLVRYDSDW